MLPFTVEQFLGAFVSFNKAIWPAQILAYLLGGLAFALVFRKGKWSDQIIAGILAAMWAWTGIGYHLTFFTAINKMAYGSAHCSSSRPQPSSMPACTRAAWCSTSMRARPDGPASRSYSTRRPSTCPRSGDGSTPLPNCRCSASHRAQSQSSPSACCCSRDNLSPACCLSIPFLWSLVGGSAAILLRVPQDWLLLASGVVSVVVLIRRDQRLAPAY